MGHLWVWCGACHEEGREATFFEPPHDITNREPGPGRPPRLELHLRRSVLRGLRLVVALTSQKRSSGPP